MIILHSEAEHDNGCRPDNTTFVVCSGRGVCECGVCVCDRRAEIEEVISGKYCECDNFSCEHYNGIVCAGPTQGICLCGNCVCNPGWTGSDCACRSSIDTCIAAGGEICSGHGVCVCGTCKCEETAENKYSGEYCENSA